MSVSDSREMIAIVGLGYVGLPLAVEFAKQRPVLGFDICGDRISELGQGTDRTQEIETEQLVAVSDHLTFTSDPSDLSKAQIFIVTVPTPIDGSNRPDLGPLQAASQTVGANLSQGDLVVFESTVYPGATEDVCVPILERASGLTFNADFTCGYSPERINPGDKQHRLPDIVKVTSGSTTEAAQKVDELYGTIIRAGTHCAPSIRVAEAAKVIENTQRDLNIALMNELSLIFDRIGVDTGSVLAAAGTKWNFLPFTPGLVGGHCIGVDPYYLTHLAEMEGYIPRMILAGRGINDSMGAFVAQRLVKEMMLRGSDLSAGRVLVLGVTFKENCPDIRNTRVVDIVEELKEFGLEVDICDPVADPGEASAVLGLSLLEKPPEGAYDGIILAVSHREFSDWTADELRKLGRDSDVVLYDLKHVLPLADSDLRL